MKLKVALLLVVCVFGAAPAAAQPYLFNRGWSIDAAGGPIPQFGVPKVIDLERATGFDPNLFWFVFSQSPFVWDTVVFQQTAGPAQLVSGSLISNADATGCSMILNATQCAPILTDVAGIYEVTATVTPGLAAAPLLVVVGGGAAVPPAGPQVFNFNGASNNVGYSYGLSVDPAQPVMIQMPALPAGTPAPAFAAAIAASIGPVGAGAFPGYGAFVGPGAAGLTIVGAGPFRFWVGDTAGIPRCQVTGGVCDFNPSVRFVGNNRELRRVEEINVEGLGFGTTDLFAFGGWGVDDTRSDGTNEFAAVTANAPGNSSGAGMALSIDETELPGGTLTDGNVLRFSLLVASDPSDPFLDPGLQARSLKFEFYDQDLGDRECCLLFDTEVDLGSAAGRAEIVGYSSAFWTQYVYEYVFTTADFDPADMEDIRAVFLMGDFSGNIPAGTSGTLLIDRAIVEVFENQAAADASPVDTGLPSILCDLPCDYNSDGVSDVIDLLDYLTCWFSASAGNCQ